MKSERISAEIARLKRKIDEYQQRLKEFERRLVDSENAEIVALVRSIDVKPNELAALLKQLRAEGITDTVLDPEESEDAYDEAQ